MIDTEKVMPTGTKLPRCGGWASSSVSRSTSRGSPGMEGDRFVLRSITDEIMYELSHLSGQEYVDVYASSVKREKAARQPSAVAPRGRAARRA